AAAIRSERAWESQEGEGCRTCAFHQVCPAKTGQQRSPQTVWQQGDFLLEMTEEAERSAA
ncbi:hypothetical protein ACSTI1_00490, partial [Vibrio parahaemolyticus]